MHIVPPAVSDALKQNNRRSLSAADLTDAEMMLIEEAENPAEHRYSLEDLE
jgi:hypothetical protein